MSTTASKVTPTKDFDKFSASEVDKNVTELRKAIMDRAHQIVHEIFPRKILKLNDMFMNYQGFNLTLEQIEQPLPIASNAAPVVAKDVEGPSKKRKIVDASNMETEKKDEDVPFIPSNKMIMQLLSALKKELLELVEMINTVKLWIQLNIPRIEDGNNFGVSIQEETVNELSRAEDSGFAVLESMTKYFVTRAKLVSKVLKYPNVQDYRQSVVEIDEKEFINLRMCCMDLRNNYSILHDMILKNLEKIKTPRSSNHMSHIF